MDLYQIGDDNKGICGFICMAQLLIDHGKMTMPQFNKTYGTDALKFTKEWIAIQIEHDKKLKKTSPKAATALNQSLKLTKDFKGDYSKYTAETLKDVKKWEGLALTPETICDYLDRKFDVTMLIQIYTDNDKKGKNIRDLWTSTSSNLGHGIYGLTEVGSGLVASDQISHYVYIDTRGNLMTWESQNSDALRKINADDFTHAYVRLYPK